MRFTFKLMAYFALVEAIFLFTMLVCVLTSIVHFTHLEFVQDDALLLELEAIFYFKTVLIPSILYYSYFHCNAY